MGLRTTSRMVVRDFLKNDRALLASMGSAVLICYMILSASKQHSSAVAAQSHRINALDANVATLAKMINERSADERAAATGLKAQSTAIHEVLSALRVNAHRINALDANVATLAKLTNERSADERAAATELKAQSTAIHEVLSALKSLAQDSQKQMAQSADIHFELTQKATARLGEQTAYAKSNSLRKKQQTRELEATRQQERVQGKPTSEQVQNIRDKLDTDFKSASSGKPELVEEPELVAPIQVHSGKSTIRRTWKNEAPILRVFDGETTDQISFKMCTQREFSSPWYLNAMKQIDIYADGHDDHSAPGHNWNHHWQHRKLWELAYVVHVVTTMGLCTSGKRGFVTAVGKEFLPQLFVTLGCDIVASDLPDGQVASGWDAGGMHASNMKELYTPGYKGVTWEQFNEHVHFQPENINSLSREIQQQRFDFVWSTCSVEHVGSIEKGIAAVLNSVKLLKPGGVAIHTVEFNLWSEEQTTRTENESIWRKKDMERLIAAAQTAGYIVPTVSWGAGHGKFDRVPNGQDKCAYVDHNHIKLGCFGEIKTSFAMVIQKPFETEMQSSRLISNY